MSHRYLAILLATAGTFAAAPFVLGTNPLAAGHSSGCDVTCTHCGREFCYPVPKEVTVSKHCWEVECKRVCIPAVRFPWERWFGGGCDGCDAGCDSCRPRCGRVRWVRVLKKRKYDCKKLGCDWIVNPVCDSCLDALPTDVEPVWETPPPPFDAPPVGNPPPGIDVPESSPLIPTPPPSAESASLRDLLRR